jgi:putative heme iron utilization protein
MSRPSEHGGGQAGPPIAGDPSTFPTDAELARTLVATATRAALCTLTADGYPYGSSVSYAADGGAPILLISEMAEHTVNARGDDRASVLIAADTPSGADPLSTARMTLVGRLQLLEHPGH